MESLPACTIRAEAFYCTFVSFVVETFPLLTWRRTARLYYGFLCLRSAQFAV